MVSVVSTIDTGVSIVSVVSVSMAVSMTIVAVSVSVSKGVSVVVVSISLRSSLGSSSGLSLSLPLAIVVVSMAIGVRVSMVGEAMDGRDHRVVAIGKTMAIAIVGISLGLSISRPLAVTMVKVAITKSMSIETMAIDMTEVAMAIS